MKTGFPNPSIFPTVWTNTSDQLQHSPMFNSVPPGGTDTIPGLSLRDYFAGFALQGILANAATDDEITLTKFAYDLADEMLCQRVLGGKS